MTKLLEQALGIVSSLSTKEQDEIARMMLAMSGNEAPEAIDRVHLSAVLEGLDQVRRGEFATDEEVAAAFRRFEK